VFVVCGTVWNGFCVVCVCCVWDSLEWVCKSECVQCGTFWSDFCVASVCCVWESLDFIWESEFVLCV
jgi:hypothetical protein